MEWWSAGAGGQPRAMLLCMDVSACPETAAYPVRRAGGHCRSDQRGHAGTEVADAVAAPVSGAAPGF